VVSGRCRSGGQAVGPARHVRRFDEHRAGPAGYSACLYGIAPRAECGDHGRLWEASESRNLPVTSVSGAVERRFFLRR
jgi:hypothetical protein